MMRIKIRFHLCLLFAAVLALLPSAIRTSAQKGPANASSPLQSAPVPANPAAAPMASPIIISPAIAGAGESSDAAKSTDADAAAPDRARSYYHFCRAKNYEEEALGEGHPEKLTRAIDEYKLALKADPASPQLNTGLAELYFRGGRAREAESTIRALLKIAPNSIDAHKLLGQIYLRTLSEGQESSSANSPSGNALEEAITEFEKIVALDPKSVEQRMILGQLFTIKHDAKQAEKQFLAALAIEPDSEDVVLNLARLDAESGQIESAVKLIEAVPVDDRSPKMEDALGAAYQQLKRSKDAIAAFQRAAEMEPEDLPTRDELAQALLSDDQLDAALKQYQTLLEADPENTSAEVHIGEILRRQGKYQDALAVIRKARKKDPENLEAGYNEGLLLDVLGRFDEAVETYQKMVDLASHANGAYTEEEKNNRSIFLERLGALYQEQDKTAEAVAAYQKLIDMGGETALRGYQLQVDAYTDAKEFDKAVEVAQKAVAANPKDRELKLMLAGELDDQGKSDDGIALAKGMLSNNSDDRPVWLALGQMDIRAHRWKDAEAAFNKAETLTTKPEDRTYLLFLRGELAERQKHYGPAEKLFRQALKQDPGSAMTLNYLGYMMADKGRQLPEALKMIQKAVEEEPMNGAYLDSLGWAYFKMGDNELAEENLRQAVARDQADPTVHEHMGELYEKTGRIRQAAEQWKLSLTQYAKSAAADVDPAAVAKVQKKLKNALSKLAKEDSAMGQVKAQ